MISRVLPRFKKTFRSLPKEIKYKAKESYKLWKKNPYHKSLGFKSVHPSKPIYSVKITLNWRALGIKENNNAISWFWIGSHEQYNKLINQLRKRT
ncbi:hypothetical protein H8E88_13875 [candidate division KSB1 bacterium]|nr:hypothetical protein [candidate division KSB1 bacterium]